MGFDIAPVGSNPADCPILVIITVPRFCSGPERSFETLLGRQGSKGVPASSGFAVLAPLATGMPCATAWVP